MKKNDFLNNFGTLQAPKLLVELLDFSNTIPDNHRFSMGFEFMIDKEKHMLASYSEDEDFLTSFYEFAYADGSGSTYALWLQDRDKTLDESPIVAFGSEGGYHIIARNMVDFLQILTYDVDPMIDWEDIYYYKDEPNYEQSPYNNSFIQWLEDKFNLSSVVNADTIVQRTKNILQQDFNDWMKQYYS
ncbi:hypothetical protein [Aquimarina sp. 2201CG14-23]|uniref:hypothetical protein n=1 Tax=Aquimarina mycalae TaxID=3040073 RepID=UPI0024782214|nr:hypothetical protein [Aquimarina sp. 2201CG14-23]MDH7446626.1 hypothetical protein [Aquimarina sp. 2201CG14-23]